MGHGRVVKDVKSEVGVTFITDMKRKIQGFVQWIFRTNLNVYLKKLGLEGLPLACYDPCCRSSQAISHMEAGVGG